MPTSSLAAALGKLHRGTLFSPCLTLPYSFKAMERAGGCWLFWGKDRWGCHTHPGTVKPVNQPSFWGTSQVLGKKRKRFLWLLGKMSHERRKQVYQVQYPVSICAQRSQERNVIRASLSSASPPISQLPGTLQCRCAFCMDSPAI